MPLPAETPSLTSLDLFVSVVELGSLSAAAAAHGVSQPSASARIRQLERQIGAELLTRSPNGSVPTAAGLLVTGSAESVLDAAHNLLSAVDSLVTGSNRMRVAASYTVAEQLLPRWLGQLHLAKPNTRVELEVVNSAAVLDRVRHGEAQLGFVESPGSTSGLRNRTVGTDELVVVVRPDHPWTRHRRPLSPGDLAATPLVLRETGSGTRDVFEAALAAAGLTAAPPALELGSSAAVRSAAAAGTAPAVLSRLAVQEAIDAGQLAVVPVEPLDLTRSLRAVWLAGPAVEPAATALLAIAEH